MVALKKKNKAKRPSHPEGREVCLYYRSPRESRQHGRETSFYYAGHVEGIELILQRHHLPDFLHVKRASDKFSLSGKNKILWVESPESPDKLFRQEYIKETVEFSFLISFWFTEPALYYDHTTPFQVDEKYPIHAHERHLVGINRERGWIADQAMSMIGLAFRNRISSSASAI